MLKIFKDMMHKDKRDPEKTNLLKEKHHERKRKYYTGPGSKSGHTVSSSSEQPKNEPYKMTQDARNAEFQIGRSNSRNTIGGSKIKSDAEETCSCVSCVLKKLISTDYACIACIVILLAVSIVIAIMLIYKSMPCATDTDLLTGKNKAETERLKRRIGSLKKWGYGPEKHQRNIFKRDDSSFGSFNFHEMSGITESENGLSKILDSSKLSDIQHSDRLRDFYKKLIQTDAAIRNLRKSFNDNSYAGSNFDFNNINNNFDINSNNDFNSHNDFNTNNDFNSNNDYNSKVDIDTDLELDRLKRSINFHPSRFFNFKTRDPTTQSKINNGKLITKSTINMTSTKKTNHKHSKGSRNKRFENLSGEGFTIEENKVMIQYKPNRLIPKCSHAPKDSKSDEKELAHPFYKNTQRLDELLNQFIDKKLPDLLVDRLESEMAYGENKNKKYKQPDTEEVVIIKDDELLKDYDQNQRPEDNQKDNEGNYFVNQRSDDDPSNEEVKTDKDLVKIEPTSMRTFVVKEPPKTASKDIKHSANVFENNFFEDSHGVERKKARSSTNGYDILLSISTLANPGVKRCTSKPTTVDTERPNLRKLLQANAKAEDDVAYEDSKEVLADYKVGYDDEDKENNRKKRNDIVQYDPQAAEDELKYDSTDVHNPNWKGPLPLYPDEITQMTIKGHNPDNKVEIPVHSRDSASETDDAEPIRTDVEYVEDYLDNGYERLVELAQAYSDYGLLNKQKDTISDKKAIVKERKLDTRKVEKPMKKLDNIKRGLKKRRLFKKLKQGRGLSEGIRIEFQPDPKQAVRVDSNADVISKFKEILDKHVKVSGANNLDQDISSVFSEKPHLTVNNLNLPMNSNKVNANANKDFDPNHNYVIIKKRTLKADLVAVNNVTDAVDEQFIENNEAVNEFSKDKKNFDVSKQTISSDVNSNTKDNYKLATTPIEIDKTTLNINSITDSVKFLTTPKTKLDESLEKRTKKSDRNESESSLSSFFTLLSKWFSALDGMEIGTKNLSNVLPSDTNAKVKRHNESALSESQQAHPVYDSDMIENIGHRSRVLLSVEVTNNTKKAEEFKSDERNQLATVAISTESMNKQNSTRSAQETTESIKNKDNVSNETNNRVVKRQAIDDSNLIFWNDLYDEEYGVNADTIENNIRDKHSAEKSVVKKPDSWLQDKMKKLTERFYNSSRKAAKSMVKDGSKQVKRNIKYDADGDDDSSKLDLAELTKRMKKVCKETVKAVQEMKHVEVRNNKDNLETSSLMQQLVHLMTDLLDFQVQERTCRKLPPDLQNFLEWLTSSNGDDTDLETYYKDKNDMDRLGLDFAVKLDEPTEQDLLQPSEREDTSKTDCLGTLQAVQNLIREYEEMTEDDKSVMMGVKNYLENQMHFLQKQLSYIDDNKYFNRDSRFKRDIIVDLGHTVSGTIDQTAQQLEKHYKNLKKEYKKYKAKIKPAYEGILKTTGEVNEAVTEMVRKMLKTNAKGKECPRKGFKFDPKIFQFGNNRNSLKKIDKFDKLVKVEKAGKIVKIDKTDKLGKIDKHDKIVKTKEQLKIEKNLKNKKNKRRNKSINLNKNKMATDNVGFNDYFDYDTNLDNFDFDKNDPAYSSDKGGRSIKEVYLKANEKDTRLSLSKGAHKRDSNTFDKTDIFRINDYVGEKQKDILN